MSDNFNDSDLHAFIDGALEAGEAEAVAARVLADPVLAARVAGFRADKQMLKMIYGPLADRPIPEQWLALARGHRTRPALSWRMVGSIAAVLLVALMATFGYRASQTTGGSGEIVAAALAARQTNSAQTIAVSSTADAARYAGAVSGAIALRVNVPDLGKMGYRLTAIRLYPKAPGGSAAELLYRDPQDRLFTLYLRRSDGSARFDQFERTGLRVCIWQDDRLGMVMAGNVSTAAMQRLASLAYTGLTL
jgi:anti-sigma factor RsiW